MKYSLMSLMVDSELKHETVNLIHRMMLRSVGVTEMPETAEEAFRLLIEHGIPMRNGSACFEDLVRFTKENGFDGLDMMSFEMELPGSEHRATLEKYGVVLSAVNILTPFSEAADEAEFGRMAEDTRRELDRAIEAGARKILLVPGGYGRAAGRTREQTHAIMVRGLRESLDYVAGRDVFISTETLETTCLPWCALGEMERVFSALPDLKYTHDTGNPLVANEDPIALLERFRDRLISVHFKDLGPSDSPEDAYRCMDGDYLKLVTLGTGKVDYREHLRRLLAMGYDGYITLEGGRPAADKWQEAVAALHYFRELEREIQG